MDSTPSELDPFVGDLGGGGQGSAPETPAARMAREIHFTYRVAQVVAVLMAVWLVLTLVQILVVAANPPA